MLRRWGRRREAHRRTRSHTPTSARLDPGAAPRRRSLCGRHAARRVHVQEPAQPRLLPEPPVVALVL